MRHGPTKPGNGHDNCNPLNETGQASQSSSRLLPVRPGCPPLVAEMCLIRRTLQSSIERQDRTRPRDLLSQVLHSIEWIDYMIHNYPEVLEVAETHSGLRPALRWLHFAIQRSPIIFAAALDDVLQQFGLVQNEAFLLERSHIQPGKDR
jgi:hypothetical protein